MKAISLWQPWASLMAIQAKKFETRSWALWTSLIGQRVAIHAAKRPLDEVARRLMRQEPYQTAMHGKDYGNVSKPFIMPLGAIVCTLIFDESLKTSEVNPSETERAFGDYGHGRFAWPSRDVHKLAVPVPWKGRQGIFDVPDNIEELGISLLNRG